jgi:hypothetical protein
MTVPHQWRDQREADLDPLALIVAAFLDDRDAGAALLRSLDRRQLIATAWGCALWASCWVETVHGRDGALDALRGIVRGVDDGPDAAA